ncbi:MAG: hypothetical protein PHN57_07810 [Candidatus Omnitrophica bacterium]|nr:hypothetical protein [Candidatus Omnitrophota bacterium]
MLDRGVVYPYSYEKDNDAVLFMVEKKQFYRRIKIAGMLSYIPVILATGPLAGFFAGDYLARKSGLPPYTALLCSALGFIASVMETVRIVKLVIKIDKGS